MKPLNLFPKYSWNLLSLLSFSTNNFIHELPNLIWSFLSLLFQFWRVNLGHHTLEANFAP